MSNYGIGATAIGLSCVLLFINIEVLCATQIVPRARVTLPRDTMLVPVTTSVWGMEYSVHACPKKHKAEAEAMFPGLDVSDLLVIPTCQVRFRDQPQP